MGMHLHRRHSSSSSSHGGGGGGSSRRGEAAAPPKGCMAIRVVGRGGEARPERFVVPVGYLNHPLFVALLKEAEEEFGFEQQGAITIPCGVDHFLRVQGIIESGAAGAPHHHHHHHAHGGGGGGGHHHHHFHIAGCFRA